MSEIQQVWPIPLIKEEDAALPPVPLIVQKNNAAIYAFALLGGDSIEGE